jgi:predicted ABC-type transport system involved in lysophospholipase L1 biosynthesis ATPase subunit
MVFQEDRLCEEYNALVNVDMVTGNREKSREHLRLLLEEEDLGRPCRELSGGMKRRVAIARAVAAGGDVILLGTGRREPPQGGKISSCLWSMQCGAVGHSCGRKCGTARRITCEFKKHLHHARFYGIIFK